MLNIEWYWAPGLQKVWTSGRSFPGNRTCSREIKQL